MPVMASSTSSVRVVMTVSGQPVAGLLDGRADHGVVERSVAGDVQVSGCEVDGHALDTRDLLHFLGDRGDAVRTRHPADGAREVIGGHERTSRAIASPASFSFASA